MSEGRRIGCETNEFPAIRFPSRDLSATHREVDRVHLDAISSWISGSLLIKETLIIIPIRLFVEARRKAKIRKLQVPIFIDQDIVRFDVPNESGQLI